MSRKQKHSLRDVVNAILYLVKTGCQWRMIPSDFSTWNSVYYWKVLKGTRWLLLCNHENISESQETHLKNALDMNKPLAQAYYLKESIHEIWMQKSKPDASKVLNDWIDQARCTRRIHHTIERHAEGIIAWYDKRISSGKIEGINNKIKTMKRNAYGFRDDKYFILRLYDRHDSITPITG